MTPLPGPAETGEDDMWPFGLSLESVIVNGIERTGGPDMKKLFLFAAVAGLGLVSAGPPDSDEGAPEARSGYPPCSARVTDECIQLYERGVRTRENLAENRGRERHADRHRHGGQHGDRHRHMRDMAVAAQGERRPAAGGYPPCSATVKDECRQRRVLARRVRMAGERG